MRNWFIGFDANMTRRNFLTQLRAFSADTEKLAEVNFGGKIILPNSALEQLTRLNMMLPILFKVTNSAAGDALVATHCGVLKFTAPEGQCLLPNWMMKQLKLSEGSQLRIESDFLPRATLAKLKPLSPQFIDVVNPHAVLMDELKKFACLTKNDTIAVRYADQVLEFLVQDLEPDNAVCVINCGMVLHFDDLDGYSDSEAQKEDGQGEDGARDPGQRFIYTADIVELHRLVDEYIGKVGRAEFEELIKRIEADDRLVSRQKNHEENSNHVSDNIDFLQSQELLQTELHQFKAIEQSVDAVKEEDQAVVQQLDIPNNEVSVSMETLTLRSRSPQRNSDRWSTTDESTVSNEQTNIADESPTGDDVSRAFSAAGTKEPRKLSNHSKNVVQTVFNAELQKNLRRPRRVKGLVWRSNQVQNPVFFQNAKPPTKNDKEEDHISFNTNMKRPHFVVQLRVFSFDIEKLAELGFGGMILLPHTALEPLLQTNPQFPMMFKVTNPSTDIPLSTHCGVLEFTAPEGRCFFPNWMMSQLKLSDGDVVQIESATLPMATSVRLEPLGDVICSNPNALLGVELRKYACLSKDDKIVVRFADHLFEFLVKDVQPNNSGGILHHYHLHLDIDNPEGYDEEHQKKSD